MVSFFFLFNHLIVHVIRCISSNMGFSYVFILFWPLYHIDRKIKFYKKTSWSILPSWFCWWFSGRNAGRFRLCPHIADYIKVLASSLVDIMPSIWISLHLYFLQMSQKYGLIYVITKLGLLFVYDLESASAVYRNRISPDPIFLTSEAAAAGGFYAINRRGQVLLATVNEATIVPFVSGQVWFQTSSLQDLGKKH